jgi:hypothetical protein
MMQQVHHQALRHRNQNYFREKYGDICEIVYCNTTNIVDDAACDKGFNISSLAEAY